MVRSDQQSPIGRRARSGCGCYTRVFFLALTTCSPVLLACTCVSGAKANLLADSSPIRPVRVLIVEAADEVRVRGNPMLTWRAESAAAETAESLLLMAIDAAGKLIINGRPVAQTTIDIQSAGEGSLFVSSSRPGDRSLELEYPGMLRVRAGGNGISVINEVPLETYVGCVVANEVWPTFQVEAYRGQAVISRTFVLYQMDRRPSAAVDVTATQGSQVYRGIRRDEVGERARQAAEYTSGIVLTYSAADGRQNLFCAYFSAACGGHSQSAAFLGPESDVPPLAGGVECDYCRIAPGETYRWGPLMLPVGEVMGRLTARYPEVSKLGTLSSIESIERAESGRTVTLRLTGSGGEVYELLAERFRLAVDPMRIRSTHFRVRIDQEQMIFEDGRGFGHGLGLCQWGMEGQARAGRTAGQILHYYYPGAQLTRAY